MSDAGTAAMYAARLRECERARDELGAEVERLARERDAALASREAVAEDRLSRHLADQRRIDGRDETIDTLTRERDDERARANEWLTQLHDAQRERDEAQHMIDGRDATIGALMRERTERRVALLRLERERDEAVASIDAVADNRARWEQRTEKARDELRDLVDALSLDDGPRAKAIQHARAVLEEWGMR